MNFWAIIIQIYKKNFIVAVNVQPIMLYLELNDYAP